MAIEEITCTSTETDITIRDGDFQDARIVQRIEVIKCAMKGDTTDGTFSLPMTLPITGRIQQFVTDPSGVTAPDANYDLVLTHPDHGYDIAGGALTNLSDTATQIWFPEDGAAAIWPLGIWVEGVTPTITAAQQTTVSALWDLYIFILKAC